jgi:glycosyltransferase involved in cell wall biosynthesis
VGIAPIGLDASSSHLNIYVSGSERRTALMASLSIIHTENSAGWGGQEIRILTESQRMLERGHRVRLIAPSHTPIAAAARKRHVPLTTLPISRKTPQALMALRGFIAARGVGIDILNTHSSTDSWLAALACATLAKPPKIVRTRHVSTSVTGRLATRWLYARAAAHIVTTGEALRCQLIEGMNVDPERITSVPTGIDLNLFVPGNAREARELLKLNDRQTLGIVATLRTWKGHKFLFDAIAADRDGWRDWDVLIIGDGPHRPHLENQVQSLRLCNTVRFVNHQDNVVPWLQALDLFVLPSYGDEGVPQAILQAMACGLAVVSTFVGAIAEAVHNGTTGLLVAPSSASALAGALAHMRDNPLRRRQFGMNGMAVAHRSFGIDLMADRMESVLRGVLARDR